MLIHAKVAKNIVFLHSYQGKIMKVRLLKMFAMLAGVLSAAVSFAQTLPLLPQDPAIHSSVFSNGLSCYLTENKYCRQIADFTLLRRDYEGNELVCTQENVIVSSDMIVDTLLLHLMRRVEADKRPADYAIVISGDIDAATVMTKLKYMSLMVDSSVPSAMPEYIWNGNGKVSATVSADAQRGLSTVHFQWQAPRIPTQNANTIQSMVYEKATWELGEAASMLIKRTLRKQDIPYADVSYYHDSCTSGFTHDCFSFDVTVVQENAAKAQNAVASVLSFLNQGNIYFNDFLLAEKTYISGLENSIGRADRTNAEYTRLCRDAFLYNRPLSSDKERLAYLESKDISGMKRKGMFTDITSALMDIDVPSDTIEVVSSAALQNDTLALPGQNIKMKFRSLKKDSFSGGVVWTFANGFKVIYKKMPTAKKLYYSMSLNGGFGNIENLESGEGAYMSEYLDHCWISGMKGSYFKDVLNLSGMTLNTKVGLLNTVISGQVENRNATLMIKALLAVANERRPDPVELDFHSRCEDLRQSMLKNADMRAVLDGLLCPGYNYTLFKTEDGVGKNTFEKADKLFSYLTSKMNDGMLVIIGDMDETELKKLLQMYVGGFRVRNIASRRPSIHYHPVTGWFSYNVEGEKEGAYVVITTPISMTSANHFATEIAMKIFKRRLQSAFEAKGLSADLAFTRGIYPDERFSMMVTLSGKCGREEIACVKEMLAQCQENITAEELTAYKEYVKNTYALHLERPEYWLRVIPLRHLEGKDFTSGYAAKIDAVSQEMLHDVFKLLHKGAGIDYIITKK